MFKVNNKYTRMASYAILFKSHCKQAEANYTQKWNRSVIFWFYIFPFLIMNLTFTVLQPLENFDLNDILTTCNIGSTNISAPSFSILQGIYLHHKLFQGQHYLIFKKSFLCLIKDKKNLMVYSRAEQYSFSYQRYFLQLEVDLINPKLCCRRNLWRYWYFSFHWNATIHFFWDKSLVDGKFCMLYPSFSVLSKLLSDYFPSVVP